MEELDNWQSEDEEFETNDKNDAFCERRQPNRGCKTNKNLILNQSDKSNSTDEEILDEVITKAIDLAISEPAQKLFCPSCPFKCAAVEELEKHDKFYHQPWPCLSKSDEMHEVPEKIVDVQSDLESNKEDNIVIENDEHFEDYIDQQLNSDVIAYMDKNWVENHVFPTKEIDNSSNSSQEDTNDKEEVQKFVCCVCNSDFENNSMLEDHVRECFENCNMYDD